MCDEFLSGWGSGAYRPRPAAAAAVALLALTLAAGCGPRAGESGGAQDLGAKPTIFNRFSTIPTPDWSIDGAEVTFSIPFVLRARDLDANMRWVEIEVLYTDTCGGVAQHVSLTEGLDPKYWPYVDISVPDGLTTEAVRVPKDCYPDGDNFTVQLRVRDSRGNLSNRLEDTVTVGAGQGGTP